MLNFNQLSYWEKETYINHTDYLIVGSGIVGLSTAIHLKERHPNQKVTVLERGYLPSGASSKNAGFSCIGSPSELLDDLSHSDESSVFSTVEKRWKGLLYLRALIGDSNMNYQSLGSNELFTPKDEAVFERCLDQMSYLNAQLENITGIKTVFARNKEVCSSAGFKGFENAISHAAEGQINTGMMIQSLIQLAQEKGIIILNNIEALEVYGKTLKTNHGEVNFETLAICTNGFAKTLLPEEDVTPARAQVVVTSPIQQLKFKGIYHFDAGYYYFRNVGDRVLFGGGRNLDFKGEATTQQITTTEITGHLEHLLKTQILPDTDFEIEHSWAGTMGVGQTKSPIIKRVSDDIFCGIRLGGMGVAIGTLVGKELAEIISY